MSASKPWLEVKHGRYYVGLWYVELHPSLTRFGRGGNLLAGLDRADREPTKWRAFFRIRHYRDERVFEHDDYEVGWETLTVGTETEAEAKARGALQIMAMAAGSTVDFFEVRGDHHKLLERAMASPPRWLNMSAVQVDRPAGGRR